MHGDEVTLAEALKPAGYVSGCFGKWHNGANHPSTARGQGFDEFFGFTAGSSRTTSIPRWSTMASRRCGKGSSRT
jgi:arylsulfatase A-like enzyme